MQNAGIDKGADEFYDVAKDAHENNEYRRYSHARPVHPHTPGHHTEKAHHHGSGQDSHEHTENRKHETDNSIITKRRANAFLLLYLRKEFFWLSYDCAYFLEEIHNLKKKEGVFKVLLILNRVVVVLRMVLVA